MPRDVAETFDAGLRETFAGFAAGLAHSDVPARVRERALHHMLDATGVALAATRFDFAHRTLTAMQALGGGGATPVIGMPARLAPRDAALVNGVLCHGLDYDDTHIAGVVHPTVSVLPAVLAAASLSGASGEEAVTAYVIGVDVAARLGMAARGGFHQVGFHPTGVCGAFGCAVAAGRLMGLGERQLAEAQGIALSMASGSLEFLADGAWTKRMHPGWAAAAGVTAAALAREGFIGASKPYEGRFGLYNSYLGVESGRLDLPLATEGLGESWAVSDTAIKPFPACHFTHACVDAALALHEEGVDPGAIEAVEALVPAETMKTICEPAAAKKRPANSYDAQFSTHYLVASSLIRGRFGLRELEAEALADPAVHALADRVSCRADSESAFPRAYSGEVILRLTDGTARNRREQINRGAADRPLSDDEIVAKYRDNAATALGRDHAARIEAALLGLDGAEPAAARLAVLARP